MFPKKGKTFHGQGPTGADDLSFNEAIARALRRELGLTHQAAKTIMRWTNANERTAKHWLTGAHGPSGMHLVQLMHHSDEVLQTVLLLSGRSVTWSADKSAQLLFHLQAALECLDRMD